MLIGIITRLTKFNFILFMCNFDTTKFNIKELIASTAGYLLP